MRPWKVLLAMALLLIGTPTHRADAGINMTGDWYLGIAQQPSVLVHVIQTGPALQIEGSFNYQQGTIDSATGAFTWAGIDIVDGDCGTGFRGVVTPDGRMLAGTAEEIVTPPDCYSIGCACTGSIPLGPLYGSRSPCGNGIIDPGEACDDGNLGRTGCCALDCSSAMPAGTACPTDDLCANSACNGSGTCVRTLAPAVGCTVGAADSRLTVRAAPPPATVLWTWLRGTPTPGSEYGDPTRTTDYALCLYDSSAGGAFLGMRLFIPAGRTCGRQPCWRSTHAGFKYFDRAETTAGVQRMSLRAARGKSSITLKAFGPNLMLPTLPLQKNPMVVVQVRNSAGACWESDYRTARMNDATQFRAKGD